MDVPRFFTRVDRILRRSLGVSETAPTDTTVKPAPPVDPEIKDEDDFSFLNDIPGGDQPGVYIPDSLKGQVSWEVEEIDEEGNPVHPRDEL